MRPTIFVFSMVDYPRIRPQHFCTFRHGWVHDTESGALTIMQPHLGSCITFSKCSAHPVPVITRTSPDYLLPLNLLTCQCNILYWRHYKDPTMAEERTEESNRARNFSKNPTMAEDIAEEAAQRVYAKRLAVKEKVRKESLLKNHKDNV